MPRPRHENPSPDALRKRAQRERAAGKNPHTPAKTAPSGRLVPVTVYVPPSSVKMIEHAARTARKHARIPETEVPG